MNVSPRSVAYAKTIQEHGSPELQKAVNAGEISLSRAALEIPETQKRIADRCVKRSDERRAEEPEAKSETVSDLDFDDIISSRASASATRATEPRKIDRDEPPPVVMAPEEEAWDESYDIEKTPEEEAALDAFYDIEIFFDGISVLDPKTVASNLNDDDEDEPRARERALGYAESCIRWFTDFAEALRQLSSAPAPAASASAPAEAPGIQTSQI